MKIERTILSKLQKWQQSAGRKPLLLQGARQVGKTWLLKEFGSINFSDTAYFNFEEMPDLKQIFELNKDVNRLLPQLSLIHGKRIRPQETLIILDEIQECNDALNSLKYFNENAPEYAVAAAGSLLGVSMSRGNSFPVGKVDFLTVYPLSFLEFLSASAPNLFDFLLHWDLTSFIPDVFFQPLIEQFKLYFISGGMPEAVTALSETQNLQLVQQRLTDILNAYKLDFSKHSENSLVPKITHVFDAVPSQLARENKKFIYRNIKSGARAREYEDALLWLQQAGLIYRIFRCEKPSLPISGYDDLSAFKVYLSDVGLLRRLSGLDPAILLGGNRLFSEFKGAFTENYVLQSLVPLFDTVPRYWTSGNKAEVDFLIQYKNDIIPIEVKSNENIQGKSLSVYTDKYSPKLKIRYSLRNFKQDANLLNIPLFLTDRTKDILEHYS